MSKKSFLLKQKARGEVPEKIKSLFAQAAAVFSSDKVAANRYVAQARNLAMRFKVRLPQEVRRRWCKNCYAFLVPGVNCRVRTKEGYVVYACAECKKLMKFPTASKKMVKSVLKRNI